MSKFYFLFTMGSLKNKLSKLNLGIIYNIKLINLGFNELMHFPTSAQRTFLYLGKWNFHIFLEWSFLTLYFSYILGSNFSSSKIIKNLLLKSLYSGNEIF